jgi:mandelate racemase
VAADAIALRDEGGFTALKLRLGRDRASDDLAAIHAIRAAVGDDIELMADFNQGFEPPRDCRRLFGLSYAALAGCSSMA